MQTVLLSADLATFTYVLAQTLRWTCSPSDRLTRRFWTFALVTLWGHALIAFGIAHHWSHSAAWEHTASRTAESTGWNSGAGLLFNEVLLIWWTADILWSWLSTNPRPPRWWTISLELYLAFMFFNAAIPFAPLERRWIGVIAFFTLVVFWLKAWRNRTVSGIP